MSTNLTEKSSETLSAIPNPRVREVIARRFGLGGKQRETLEAIGQDQAYKITRERVRQIEENGLKVLSQPKLMSSLKPVFSLLESYLAENGGLVREDKIFADLAQQGDAGAILLFLTLGPQFHRVGQTEKFHPVWAINKNNIKRSAKVVDGLVKHFNSKNNIVTQQELVQLAKKRDAGISEAALVAYVDACKFIDQNHFGHFGLSHWPQIKPKGVKDKAYMVFQKEKRPIHFAEVTNLINQEAFGGRPAYVQTVHNELIKDQRFVLVGRGVYALSEWGYQPGTVIELIGSLLNRNGSLTKEQIIEEVMKQRLVKENTILINLQNRKLFKRDQEGKYSLV